MAVPQPARWWLATFVFFAALVLSNPCTIHSAAARNVKRTSSTDLTPSLAARPAPPPETVVAAVRDAERSTGIDPALLLTIAATESRFQANAKNRTSSALGLLQFTKQTWLENLKKFGGKHGLSHLASLIHRSDIGYLVVHGPARDRISALRNDPRIATLLAAERLDYQKEQSKDRHLQFVDFYLIHALGAAGANRFIEAVSNRPSVPCKAVVGDVAWKGSGLFRDLPHGAATSLGAAYDVISVRFEQRRSYYASLLDHDAAAATYPKPDPEEAGNWTAPR